MAVVFILQPDNKKTVTEIIKRQADLFINTAVLDLKMFLHLSFNMPNFEGQIKEGVGGNDDEQGDDQTQDEIGPNYQHGQDQ